MFFFNLFSTTTLGGPVRTTRFGNAYRLLQDRMLSELYSEIY